MVQQAIQSGRLTRPDRCSDCGKKRFVEAHHWRGYRYPLTVRWLCRSCHRYAEGPERMWFQISLWSYGRPRRLKIGDNSIAWRKDAGWQSWWVDVRTRDYWRFRKHFVKYREFEWVNRELLDYRYAAHLAGVRAELYRASNSLARLRRERKRLSGLRDRIRYWEQRSRKRRQLLKNGAMGFA